LSHGGFRSRKGSPPSIRAPPGFARERVTWSRSAAEAALGPAEGRVVSVAAIESYGTAVGSGDASGAASSTSSASLAGESPVTERS
jgi:hypothetical protein